MRLPLIGALKANDKLTSGLSNAFDWLFLRESLVKSGKTPYEVILEDEPMSLRYYPTPPKNNVTISDGSQMPVRPRNRQVPLILVPPLGVTTETFDLMPHRSLARYMSARGFYTYLVDWGEPKKEHAHLSLKDYADTMLGDAIKKVREHSGSEEVSMMGWCMGGLLILLHTGFTKDPNIKNIITVASPIDLRGGGIVARSATALDAPARLVRKYSNWRLHKLNPALLASPNWLTTLGFKLTDPIGSITTYWDLLTRLWDREFVENHSTTSDYLNNMLLYPGGVIQDMMVSGAIDNQFAKGKMKIRGAESDLTSIQADMMVFAGDRDVLVPSPVARKLMDVVGSKDKTFTTSPGGHMGVVLGSKATDNVWEPAAEWLEQRSGDLVKDGVLNGAEKAIARAKRRAAEADFIY
ncbi:MAG: alpha/beta fold hydrolase [Gammaproteobacteria bacterium]|nr:alpha/beta fold hydrolase [Gammaproteobacteria bacterium]